jgi:tetrahydromethanopterin S-methyltransferase subunit G
MGENVSKLEEKLDDVKDRLIVIETKMDMINGLNDKVEKVDKVAAESLQSTRSAHKRLDKLDEHITWLWRTVVAGIIASGFTLAVYFLKNGGGQ